MAGRLSLAENLPQSADFLNVSLIRRRRVTADNVDILGLQTGPRQRQTQCIPPDGSHLGSTKSTARRDVLNTIAGELKERVHVLPCNLSNTDEVERWFRRRKSDGSTRILVYNAGITRDNLFVRMRDEEWDQVIAVNLTATFRLSRAATKLMMRKRFGRFIAITSVVGVTGNAGQSNYRRRRPA